ncbi:DUF1214 domain-containing protein [Streptomyces sp. NPDC058239]|uniref:DUF1214 domain-containing protein n=1 Tax=unclassified Streptomyces TaxID=2593676 RepID=UPI00365C732C
MTALGLTQRYSIGDRTPGLTHAADDSLTLRTQHAEPAEGPANWLPAPAGDFRPMIRLYTPKPQVLDGSYTLPRIEKTERVD